MRKRLTDLLVKNHLRNPPASDRLLVTDTEVRGLTLRVTPRGVGSWLVRYRVKGTADRTATGKRMQRSLVLELASLRDARQRARDVIAAARRGVDLPAEEKRQEAERAKAAAIAASARTVRELAATYVELHCKKHHRRWRDTERRFENHILPTLGDRIVGSLRRADVVELLDKLEHDKGLGEQVNRTRGTLSGFLRYAIDRGHLAENPAIDLRARKLGTAGTRVLTDAELKAIWTALADMPEPGRSFVRTLMLTAVRRDEARGMRWSEIDGALWVLPAARNKAERDFEIPLSKPMVKLLDGMDHLGPCVFTVNAKGEKPWCGHGPFKTDLDAKSGVTGWRLHDLRRTVRTRLADDLHVPGEIAERVLNHAMGKIERVYNRASYREQKAAALQAWADRLMLIVGEAGGGNVEVLRARA